MRLSLRWLPLAAFALTLSRTPEVFAQNIPTKPIEIPPAPTVNDPMLAPVPPAAKNIASWEEALAYVRSRSTDLRTAYDEVLRAEAQQRIALAGALPQINATASVTENLLTHDVYTLPGIPTLVPADTPGAVKISNPVHNVGNASVTGTMPIFNLQRWHAIGTAKESKIAAELSVEDLKRTIALGVANALVGVVTAERVAELNRIGFRSALERLELTQRKRALGAANGLDVVRAQQDVESARATLVTGDESLREARESLGLALGLPTQVGVTPAININGLEADAMRACKPAPSVEDRSDIKAARERVDIAKRNIDDVWLQFAPTANVSSTLATFTTPILLPNPTWNVQAILTIPIWDGGARYGSLRDTRALHDEAESTLEASRRQAIIQIEQARRNVGVATDSRKVAFDARQLAAELDRLTQTAYKEGQGTSLELVTAAAALRQADVNLALQDFNLVKARILAILSLANCPW